MDYGIKISKPGFDVKTCTKDQLVFDSELNTMKIAHSDAPDPFHDPGPQTFEYEHGLGYAPAFMVSGSGFFVGQEFSSYESTYYSTPIYFYYFNKCRYWLFYEEV